MRARTAVLLALLTALLVYAAQRQRHRHHHGQPQPTESASLSASVSPRARPPWSWTSPHLVTRVLDRLLPVHWQHRLRDCGALQYTDWPTVLVALMYVALTRPRWTVEQVARMRVEHGRGHHIGLRYSDEHPRHELDVINVHRLRADTGALSPVIVFCHGGAWGSGRKLLYRPAGIVLDWQCRAVCVVFSYRVYPDGTVDEQCSDLLRVIEWCRENIAAYGGDPQRIVLAGHSSGAHLTALTLARGLRQREALRGVVGCLCLSGVYHIADHYQYEALRGVEEFSPMKPACRGIALFDHYSPTCLAQSRDSLLRALPCLLIHGSEDATVPAEQSRQLARALDGTVLESVADYARYIASPQAPSTCVCALVPSDHAAVVTDLMLGAPTVTIQLIQAFLRQFHQRTVLPLQAQEDSQQASLQRVTVLSRL